MIVNWAWRQRKKIFVCCFPTISGFPAIVWIHIREQTECSAWLQTKAQKYCWAFIRWWSDRPPVEYSSPIWALFMKRDEELLERFQHGFTRMIPGLRKIPCKECLPRLKLWSLEEQRNRADLIEVFKSSRDLNGIDFLSLFEMSSMTHLWGHSLKLKKKRSRLDVQRYFFSDTVLDRWKSFPENIVQ